MSDYELALATLGLVIGVGFIMWLIVTLPEWIWRWWHKKKDREPVMIRGEDEPKRLTLIYHSGYAAEFNPDRDWAERWCIFSRYLDEEGVFYTDSGEHAEELLRFFAGPEEGGQG